MAGQDIFCEYGKSWRSSVETAEKEMAETQITTKRENNASARRNQVPFSTAGRLGCLRPDLNQLPSPGENSELTTFHFDACLNAVELSKQQMAL